VVCGRPGARPAVVSIAVTRSADKRAQELDRLVIVKSSFAGRFRRRRSRQTSEVHSNQKHPG